jgi:hypothetical protein
VNVILDRDLCAKLPFSSRRDRPGAIRQSVLSPSNMTPLLFNATSNFLWSGIVKLSESLFASGALQNPPVDVEDC